MIGDWLPIVDWGLRIDWVIADWCVHSTAGYPIRDREIFSRLRNADCGLLIDGLWIVDWD
jgi:hypothetical protein